MRKLLSLVVILTLFTSFSTNAQEESKKDLKGPKIEFENETIDYGEVEYASNGQREFVFKNTGNAPLIITKAKGSCGCTVPTPPKEPIMPGKTGIIKVKYDTKRGGRPFSKSVTIYSNAVNSPTKVLKIKGKVLANPNAAPKVKPSVAAQKK